MAKITSHQSGVPGDVNAQFAVNADDGGDRTAPCHDYSVSHADCPAANQIAFYQPDRVGLTNEILLALVYDRLDRFQKGPHACEENKAAMGHVHAALHNLRLRTLRQASEGKKMAEEKARVVVTDAVVVVGAAKFTPAELSAWKTWQRVEAAAKGVEPPLTLAEVEALATVPGANKNGVAEFKSALASTAAAK